MVWFFLKPSPEQLDRTSLANSPAVLAQRDAVPRKLGASWEIQRSRSNPVITGNTEALIILAPDGTLRTPNLPGSRESGLPISKAF